MARQIKNRPNLDGIISSSEKMFYGMGPRVPTSSCLTSCPSRPATRQSEKFAPLGSKLRSQVPTMRVMHIYFLMARSSQDVFLGTTPHPMNRVGK